MGSIKPFIFVTLPSDLIAKILSYYNFFEDSKQLLRRLSRKTRVLNQDSNLELDRVLIKWKEP